MKLNQTLKNIFTMVFGTGVAQIIPVVISPLLTRLYTPDDFGKYGIYLAIIGILNPIVTLRYDLAIMLKVDGRELKYIVHTAVLVTTTISVLAFILVIVLKMFTHLKIINEMLLVPISLLLIGIYQCYYYWNNKTGHYEIISKSNIYKSIIVGLTSIIFGYLNYGYMGLIYGIITAQIVQLSYIFYKSNLSIEIQYIFSYSRLIVIFRRYSNYPKYSSTSAIIQSLSSQSPIVILESLFGSFTSGLYYFGQKIINVPITFIGRSVGAVYYKDIADNIERVTKAEVIKKNFYGLNLMIIPIMALILFFGEDIFEIVFGEEWGTAGTYASLMVPWIMYNFIALPFIFNFEILNKQKALTKLNTITLSLRLASLFLGYLLYQDPYYSILFFSIVSGVMYFVVMIYSLMIIDFEKIRELIFVNIIGIATVFTLTYLVKEFVF